VTTYRGENQHRGIHAVVVGAGAIGSHLIPLISRSDALREVTVIDKDTYDDTNLWSQNIAKADVGQPKAWVQERRIRQLRQDVRVHAIAGDFQQVPLGQLRADVIFGCVDSRITRLHINQCAFRLGIPYIDAGVFPDGLAARIHVYEPAEGAACLECAWDERDYRALEQEYPCGSAAVVYPSHAPAGLGALAAAMQGIEFLKLTGHSDGQVAAGRQVLLDSMWHRHRVVEFRRNPDCRFDHQTWNIELIDCPPHAITLGQSFELGRDIRYPHEPIHLRLERKSFVTRLVCPDCQISRNVLRLQASLRPRLCPRCRRRMVVAPFGLRDRIDQSELPRKQLAWSLRDLGLQPGDVYTISGASGSRHFELTTGREESRV